MSIVTKILIYIYKYIPYRLFTVFALHIFFIYFSSWLAAQQVIYLLYIYISLWRLLPVFLLPSHGDNIASRKIPQSMAVAKLGYYDLLWSSWISHEQYFWAKPYYISHLLMDILDALLSSRSSRSTDRISLQKSPRRKRSSTWQLGGSQRASPWDTTSSGR